MFIFLSRALRSLPLARALGNVFQKNEKKIKQHLCTGYFHTVKPMSAPDEAQKMLCIIASLEFFSCVSTLRLLFHHNCPVRSQRLCVKGRSLCSTFLTRNLNGLVSRRHQRALPPELENFRRAFFLDPTDWPWVSENELRLIRSGTSSVYYPCSSLCFLCVERTV